ncbi:hypothetical protein BJY04DRAFT_178125 [Aspergillus karnatakaensis]|uniref:uncharacterized protein n=1 Tax=Aspergillus karnatakaensis TaxID=1810916 RepID=UPI003CCDF5D8
MTWSTSETIALITLVIAIPTSVVGASSLMLKLRAGRSKRTSDFSCSESIVPATSIDLEAATPRPTDPLNETPDKPSL